MTTISIKCIKTYPSNTWNQLTIIFYPNSIGFWQRWWQENVSIDSLQLQLHLMVLICTNISSLWLDMLWKIFCQLPSLTVLPSSSITVLPSYKIKEHWSMSHQLDLSKLHQPHINDNASAFYSRVNNQSWHLILTPPSRSKSENQQSNRN